VAYTDLGEATTECELFQRATPGRARFAEPFMTAASPASSRRSCSTPTTARTSATSAPWPARCVRSTSDRRARVRAAAGLPRSRHGARPLLPGRAARPVPRRRRPSHRRDQRGGAAIPRDRVRLHLCWGNYDGPHTHDVRWSRFCRSSIARGWRALLALASPRHQHELKPSVAILPDGCFLPGSSTPRQRRGSIRRSSPTASRRRRDLGDRTRSWPASIALRHVRGLSARRGEHRLDEAPRAPRWS